MKTGKRTIWIFFTGVLLISRFFLPPVQGVTPVPVVPTTNKNTGSLEIHVDMPDVKVYLNGNIEGLAHPDRPLKRPYFPAGEVTITVRTRDIPSRSRTVRVSPGETVRADFFLLADSPAVKQKINRADRLFRQNRLISPPGKNAFDLYRQVLSADRTHAAAREGLQKVLEALKKRGDQSFQTKAYAEAGRHYRDYLSALDKVRPILEDPALAAVEERMTRRIRILNHLDRPQDRLLAEADRLFDRRRMVTPENENAFDLYRSVLAVDPGNRHARNRIYDMIRFYGMLGQNTEADNLRRAIQYYRNGRMVVRYVTDTFGDRALKDGKDFGERIAELEERISAAEKLSDEGDRYFIAQRFTTPEQGNAFERYKAALALDPTHANARQRLREMIAFYMEQGDTAYDAGDHAAARPYYRQGGQVAEYALTVMNDETIRGIHTRVRMRLDRLDRVALLIQEADVYYRQQQYTEPEEENALNLYRAVLDIYPENRYALDRIRKMMDHFSRQGKTAEQQGDLKTALALYHQHRQIAADLLARTEDEKFRRNIDDIRKRIDDLEQKMKTVRLQETRQNLDRHLELYQALRIKEGEHQNVAREIVAVMNAIHRELTTLETLYQEALEEGEDIQDQIDHVRQVRRELEVDLSARTGKAF